MSKTESQEKQDVKIVREFSSSRVDLWKYFTEPDWIKKWFGSKDYTIPFASIELSVGGKTVYCMRSAEGQDTWGVGFFKEIRKPEKIVMTDSFADEKGNPVPASYYGMGDDWPLEMLITYLFEELGKDRSRVTLVHEGLPIGHDADLTIQGWSESFDKLEAILKR